MKIRVLCLALLFPLPVLAQDRPTEEGVEGSRGRGVEGGSTRPPAPERRLRLALASTSAFGTTNAGFFNQLVGPRIDYRFTSRFALGGSLAYANLKGKDERKHNALPEVMLEYRAPITGDEFGVPVRFAGGFLPRNGPTLRLSAGLDFAFNDAFSVELIPLEPMVWVTRERPEVSFNASLGLRLHL